MLNFSCRISNRLRYISLFPRECDEIFNIDIQINFRSDRLISSFPRSMDSLLGQPGCFPIEKNSTKSLSSRGDRGKRFPSRFEAASPLSLPPNNARFYTRLDPDATCW